MDDIKTALTFFQLLLAIGNLAIMMYAFKKFLSKPQDTLATRVTALEVKLTALELKQQENMQGIERSLQMGNEEFRIMKDTSKVLQSCMLALVEFELSYCSHTGYEDNIEDLEQAKKVLHEHLANK